MKYCEVFHITRKETVIIMKKIISVLVALILVVCGFAFTANAEPSPEVEGVISIIDIIDSKGNKPSIEFIEIESGKLDKDLKPDSKDEATLAQYEVKTTGTPEYPVTVTLGIKGVKSTSTVYILVKKADGTIAKVPAVVKENGKVEFTLEEGLEKLSIIVDKKTATSIGVSDKTGDSSTVAVMGILCVAIAAAVVSAKKVKA